MYSSFLEFTKQDLLSKHTATPPDSGLYDGTSETDGKTKVTATGCSTMSSSKQPVRVQSHPKQLIDAIVTMAIIQLCLLVAFVPNSVVELLNLFTKVPTNVQAATRIFTVLHPVINPIIYIWRMPELRSEISRICCRK